MDLWKLMSVFHITSNLFLSDSDLISGFLELQLQLAIRKVTIIHTSFLKLYQRQGPSLHFIFTVCHFLK